jgi:hypothetical protein
MILEILAAVALAAGLVFAFRRTGALNREVQHVRSQNYERHYELVDQIDRLRTEVKTLRREVRRAAGAPERFTPDMTFAEAYDLHPAAQTVLAGFHIGGCNSCAVDEEETLAEGAAHNGASLDDLLQSLNGLLDGRPPAAPLPSRSGLIQIDLS